MRAVIDEAEIMGGLYGEGIIACRGAFDADWANRMAQDIWTVWDEEDLVGCDALKQLSRTHGEIKSMRTPVASRGRGAGRAVLEHIILIAQQRGYTRLGLETGTHVAFAPAHSLYRSKGFVASGPFGNYRLDPHNVFMELQLSGGAA